MSNKPLKVGVDIDGVLIDTDSHAYLKFCEQELGWNINYEAFRKNHSWPEATGQNSPAVIGEAFERFINQVEQAQKPIQGAHEALKQIGERADIYLITARTGLLRTVTEQFVQTHLYDVQYHELSMDNMHIKTQRLLEFGIDYFIDDSYNEISYILNSSSPTTIIPFPSFHGTQRWNDINDDRIYWLSVWEYLKKGVSIEQHPAIRQQAWKEIVQVVLQQAPASV